MKLEINEDSSELRCPLCFRIVAITDGMTAEHTAIDETVVLLSVLACLLSPTLRKTMGPLPVTRCPASGAIVTRRRKLELVP